ncbi:AzlC family ABC transporter permease [Pseudactinotalea terrae]|uniref:AzlC family ABC transporter permease n=1 Tax=Pseudactinotalea terrae TaxID=1743262 RepID=UPI001F4F2289|nr:AzlC family ABC transporter permease [Pseudactinotalea terrae]
MRASPSVRSAVRQGISVGLATGAYGISFGALSVAAGLDVWQTCVLSLLMFTGGSQFAFIGIIGAGGGGAAATATAALLGVRNSLYGLQMASLLKPRRLVRLGAAQITIDESTAVALAQPDEPAARAGFWSAGLGVFVFWNLATLGGALLGDVLGDPARWGLDGAAAAAFLALLWPRLKQRQAQTIGVVAAVVAAIMIPIAPAGVPVLAAAAVTAGIAWWQYREPPHVRSAA